MTQPDITPADLVHWKKLCEEAIYLRSLDTNRALRLTPETEDGLLSFLTALIPAYERVVKENMKLEEGVAELQDLEERLVIQRDRLTTQLAMEQTASNRTIEQLVARKDALEEQYRILSEQSRLTLEVAAKRQEALEAQVQALEGERDVLRVEIAQREKIRIGLEKAVGRILEIPDDDAPAMVALRDCFRDAVKAAP